MDELVPSGQTLDRRENEHPESQEVSKTESLPIDTPNQSLSEDISYTVHESTRRQLPQRLTRGIQKPTYEPQLSSKVRYPMNHYMSTHRLSQTNRSFVNQLSNASIPNCV